MSDDIRSISFEFMCVCVCVFCIENIAEGRFNFLSINETRVLKSLSIEVSRTVARAIKNSICDMSLHKSNQSKQSSQ